MPACLINPAQAEVMSPLKYPAGNMFPVMTVHCVHLVIYQQQLNLPEAPSWPAPLPWQAVRSFRAGGTDRPWQYKYRHSSPPAKLGRTPCWTRSLWPSASDIRPKNLIIFTQTYSNQSCETIPPKENALNQQLHCKDTVPEICNKYSQKWSWAASFPNSHILYLWAIYIFSQFAHLFCCSKIGGPIAGMRPRSFISGNT